MTNGKNKREDDGVVMENMLMVDQVNFLLVFLEGVLSFLSPCVLPLIPLYIGYLAGEGKEIKEDGTIIYQRKTVFWHTVCFVLGISFTFFILGMSFSALGSFLKEYQSVIAKIAGIIILFMGCIQLGWIKIPFLQKEHKLTSQKGQGKKRKMTPVLALLMGFTFSFAWTPCIGPALASVLALASSSSSMFMGNVLVLLYALGFSIPFLLVGFFTTQVLNFFQEKKKIVQITIKIAGVLLIIMGILTITGLTEKWGTAFSNGTAQNQSTDSLENGQGNEQETKQQNQTSSQNKDQKNTSLAPDFTVVDQNGKTHTLSDYKGKVVFLNFWATWCPPCKQELPHIEEIYQEYGKNEKEVIVLGITNPTSKQYPYSQDQKTKEEIKQFVEESGLTYPTLFDETGEIFAQYGIQAFPTTFMINKEGEIYGYITGALTKDNMKGIIQQTIENKRK